MRSETNLESLKEVARHFLMLNPTPTEYSPMLILHPFTTSAFVPIRDHADDEPGFGNILEDSVALKKWRGQIREAIDGATSPDLLRTLITTPYQTAYLKYAAPFLSTEDLSHHLASVWTSIEAPNADPNLPKSEMIKLFKRADPQHLMTEDEYDRFQNFEDNVRIYRGVTPHTAKRVRAMSWTLAKHVAEWFASRFGEAGTVYSATIPKEHILAYFEGRSEAEVVVDPKHLDSIVIEKEMEPNNSYNEINDQ